MESAVEVECNVGFIRQMCKNSVFKMIFTHHKLEDKESWDIEEYKRFDYIVIKSIADVVVVAACDALVEGESMGGSWIISLRDYKHIIKRILCPKQ